MLKELPAEAKTLNSFPEDFPLPAVLEGLLDHVRVFLFANDHPAIPNLSKCAMKEYSELDFNVELLLPQSPSIVFSHSGSVTGENSANLPDDEAASGPNSVDPHT